MRELVAVDWLGAGLSAAGLSALLAGPSRPVRVLLAMLLGETSRLVLALLVAGHLEAWTFGGAFTHLQAAGPHDLPVVLAGPLLGALIGLVLSRRAGWDTMIYGVCGALVRVWLLE